MLLLDRYNNKMKKATIFLWIILSALLYLLLPSWGGIHKLWFQTIDGTLHDGSMHKFEAKKDNCFRRLVTMKTINI